MSALVDVSRVSVLAGPRSGAWARDLALLARGELGFDAFARRHRGIVARLAAPWARRTVGRLCRADVEQEILLVVWQAAREWEPGRLDVSGYVRMRVRHHLQKLTTRRHIRAAEVDTEFWAGLEDYRAAGRQPSAEDVAEAAERAAQVVGSLGGADRDALLGALVAGAVPGSEEGRHRFARAARRAAEVAAELDREQPGPVLYFLVPA